jgi:hypothetical protein
MLFDNLRAELRWRAARRRREELRMADRAIEVDQETTHGRDHERRSEGPGKRPRHDERTGIVSAVRVQQGSSSPKQLSIGRGYPVAAVFTRDDKRIDQRRRRA